MDRRVATRGAGRQAGDEAARPGMPRILVFPPKPLENQEGQSKTSAERQLGGSRTKYPTRYDSCCNREEEAET